MSWGCGFRTGRDRGVFGSNSGKDLPRVGLWWNWEVRSKYRTCDYIIMMSNINYDVMMM